jgi:sugar phosphate isomerase/epimerase
MKYSFMTFSCPEWDLPTILKSAAKLGYHGLEPRAEADHKHGIELSLSAAERADVRRRFEDAGLAVGCVATSVRFSTADAAERAKMREQAKAYVDLAADLGSARVRVFGGAIPEGVEKEACKGYVAESLAQIGPYAAERGVWICLETHDAFSRAKDVGETLAKAGVAGLAAAWDWQHPFTQGETVEQSYGYLEGTVQHTHVHDVVKKAGGGTQIVHMGEGVLPLEQIVSLLKRGGYGGYLSMECWTDLGPPEEALPRYVKALRELDERTGG